MLGAEFTSTLPEMARILDFPKTTTLGNWTADIPVPCRQELRLGRTRAKAVLGGSISPATPFPLTPALSPKEREPRWPLYELAGAPDMREAGLALSLSFGERAGVRGNGAYALSNQALVSGED